MKIIIRVEADSGALLALRESPGFLEAKDELDKIEHQYADFVAGLESGELSTIKIPQP